MPTMHRLQIALLEVDPPVWRRILIPSNYRLDQVAPVLLTGMGWLGYHLYEFRIGESTYADPRGEDPPEEDLPATALLGDVVAAGESFGYDFGDGWEHVVLVEDVILAMEDTEPQCVAGERACPPEDVGGPYGYAQMLTALGDPTSERGLDLLDWLGGPFDPEAFDLKAVAAALVGLSKGRARKPRKQ